MESGLGRPAVTGLALGRGCEPVLDQGLWFMDAVSEEELLGESGGVGRGFSYILLLWGRNATSIVELVSVFHSLEHSEKVEVGESLSELKTAGGEYGRRCDGDGTGDGGPKPWERRGR